MLIGPKDSRMQNFKTTLCALLALVSISFGVGPENHFFTINQVEWMGASEFTYSEVITGIEKVLNKRFRGVNKQVSKSIVDTSLSHRLDPLWVTAVVWTESSFNPKARSHRGARGLMQLMPSTAKEILERLPRSELPHWLTSKGNLVLGTYYLKKLLVRFRRNHKLATMAYNLGTSGLIRRIRKSGVPKMDYWEKIQRRYQFLIYEVQKTKQLAKTNSIKFL